SGARPQPAGQAGAVTAAQWAELQEARRRGGRSWEGATREVDRQTLWLGKVKAMQWAQLTAPANREGQEGAVGVEESLPLFFVQKVPDGKAASLASLTMQGFQTGSGYWVHLQAWHLGQQEVVTQLKVCPGCFEYRVDCKGPAWRSWQTR
ncbi:hypothetical protein H1C71_018902, partial [Ictidomys tridecemlineatus]